MDFSVNNTAKKVWFDDNCIWIELNDGRVLAVPKMWFPRLLNVPDSELEKYELSGNGIGIHWESLDEDIHVPNLLAGFGSMEYAKQNVALVRENNDYPVWT